MPHKETNHPFAVIPDFDGDPSELFSMDVPDALPILPLRGTVAFPMTIMPISIGRQGSLSLVRQAWRGKFPVGIFTQLKDTDEIPLLEGFHGIGVAGRVAKVIDFPDGTHTAILQCVSRVLLTSVSTEGKRPMGTVVPLPDDLSTDEEFDILCRTIRQKAKHMLEKGKDMPAETIMGGMKIPSNAFLVNFLCSTLPFAPDVKQKMLKADSIKARAEQLLRGINNMQTLIDIKTRIEERTQSDLNQQQREYFLHQEMKVIQDELGDQGVFKDVENIRQKAAKLNLPQNVRSLVEEETSKLSRINPQNPDYNVQLSYLETIVSLPWGHTTRDNLNLANAERTLNRDHYGMDKVKERILEHLAVLKLRGDMKSPILCLYGPPGVGKTSLGKSIAAALKRNYVRASLGGLHDEAEIRGHRRTYIGAMPGRIIKGIAKAGSGNPVFVLDEIDKISGQTVNGDPSSALLEVLDPEQNLAFHDNFLELDYDLSRVMFIATANDVSSIPRPLRDRMELIEVSGYSTEEKIEIARRHLIPKAKEAVGLTSAKGIRLGRKAIEFIIERYTRESGVRGLEKRLAELFRKIALHMAKEGGETEGSLARFAAIDPPLVVSLLGKEPFNRDTYQGNDIAGVVTGLAWTSVGGEILFIETSLSRGHGEKLTLTGNLGDVMKESAMLAIEFIKAHCDELAIDPRLFSQWNIHVHVPEGATPKDGPSAGITMVTSIVSSITQRKVRARTAMTGEITLRGKVLPVGGVKEKILAARRAGITDVVLSKDNQADIEEITPSYLTGMSFHYVDSIMDVLAFALLPQKVDHPKLFTLEDTSTTTSTPSPTA